MADVEVIEVIKTALLTRGDGKTTYIRTVLQYWDMEGKLLWEDDPCPGDKAIVKREQE